MKKTGNMKSTRVEIMEQVQDRARPTGSTLCFQKVIYHHPDGRDEAGYRFIYRGSDGNLRPQRGQARIEDGAQLKRLTDKATEAGWL